MDGWIDGHIVLKLTSISRTSGSEAKLKCSWDMDCEKHLYIKCIHASMSDLFCTHATVDAAHDGHAYSQF